MTHPLMDEIRVRAATLRRVTRAGCVDKAYECIAAATIAAEAIEDLGQMIAEAAEQGEAPPPEAVTALTNGNLGAQTSLLSAITYLLLADAKRDPADG